VIDPAWVEEIRTRLPQLPAARRERFIAQYGLPPYDANLLTASKATADFFEACLKLKPLEGDPLRQRAKAVSNWMLGELARLLNVSGLELEQAKVTPHHLVELLELIEGGTLSTTLAKSVFEEVFQSGRPPSEVVREKGYTQITDATVVDAAVAEAIATNPQAVSDYLKGKETAMRFIIGQVMKLTRGKANPALVNELVKKRLEALKKG